MIKIHRYEFVDYGDYEELEIEIYGALQYMPKNAHSVLAIFGGFERVAYSRLLYTASIGRNKDGELEHYPDSEYLDDLATLKRGNVTITEYRRL